MPGRKRAAAWLAKPSTQRRLEKRWDDILDNGTDAEMVRLIKELMDRVEGRASEQRAEQPVEIPKTLAGIQAMSAAELTAALRTLD